MWSPGICGTGKLCPLDVEPNVIVEREEAVIVSGEVTPLREVVE
jgi:hypothetical protein